MNVRLILGHATVAGLTTAVWEIAVSLPQGDPGPLLQAAGVAPFVVAGISLAVAHDAQRRGLPVQPAPQQRRPQPQPARKELVR